MAFLHARIFLEFIENISYVNNPETSEKGFDGFNQYFEHDRVLKLLYMDNICPMSFPKFSQISFKH